MPTDVSIALLFVDSGGVLEVAQPVRALVVFVLLAIGGALVLSLLGAFIDRSVDATIERPLIGIVYGGFVHIALGMVTVYLYAQLVQLTGTDSILTMAFVVVAAVGWLLLASIGFVIVGISLLEIVSYRQPWPGLLLGASIGAAVLLLPSLLVAVAIWIGIISIGVGGPTRTWVHDDQVGVKTVD